MVVFLLRNLSTILLKFARWKTQNVLEMTSESPFTWESRGGNLTCSHLYFSFTNNAKTSINLKDQPNFLIILKLFCNHLGYLIKDGQNNTFLQIFWNLNNFFQILFETKFCPKNLGDRNLTRNPNPNTQIQFGLGNGWFLYLKKLILPDPIYSEPEKNTQSTRLEQSGKSTLLYMT